MLSGTDLKSRVWNYIRKTLTKSQPKLDGIAICPFLKHYMDSIDVVETQDWEKKISQVCELLNPLGYEAVVICGPDEDYDELMSICDDYQSRYYKKDIEILLMHPDTVDPPLPLEYNFDDSPLVIVQKASTLNNSRKLLQKSGKYYKFYK
jgi:hypothetical protein